MDELGDALEPLLDQALDLGELGFDKLVEQIPADLPVVGWLVAAVRTTRNVGELLFRRKVLKFLVELGSFTEKERENFAKAAEQEPKQRARVGEVVLSLLHHFDDSEKAALLARTFAAYVRGAIDYGNFRVIGGVIRSAQVQDLRFLSQISAKGQFPSDVVLRLMAVGLVEKRDPDPPPFGMGKPFTPTIGRDTLFVRTHFADVFLDVLFGVKTTRDDDGLIVEEEEELSSSEDDD